MNISKPTLAAAVVLTSVSPALAQEPALYPDKGEGSPLALHEEWIMEGWERRDGDPPRPSS
jgi:hypothetical protein